MSYADTVMRVRDADTETEVMIERLDGHGEDGAVVEVQVTLGYGTPATAHRGYVRLPADHFHALCGWLQDHASALRSVEWAADRAAQEDADAREAEERAAVAALVRHANRGAPEIEDAIAALRRLLQGDAE